VVLAALPRTRHGKVDRGGLPAASPERPPDLAYAAPATPAEQALAAIWAEVLALEAIGLDDNFFDLGGHSLVAVKLVARIQAALGIDLPLRAVFDAPTLRAMATLAEAAAHEPRDSPARPEGPIGALERRRYRVEADGGSLQAAIREHLGFGTPHADGPLPR
jgi:acyl carrier protein